MHKPITRIFMVILGVLLPASTEAQNVLWDQQPSAPLQGVANQSFPDNPTFDLFAASFVTLGSGNSLVEIDSVTSYFLSDPPGPAWQNEVSQAVLNIFDGDPLTSADDPTAGGDFGAIVNVNIVDAGDRLVVSADLSQNQIQLLSGDYWFGLTPIGNGGSTFLQGFQLVSEFKGVQSQFRNPGGGFGVGGVLDWEASSNLLGRDAHGLSLTITGNVVPEPTSVGLLMVLGLTGFVRRR